MIWGQNLSEITLATYCKHCADRTCCCYAGLHYVYSTFSRIIIPRRRLLIIPCGCVRRRWKFGGSNCWTKSRQRLSNETHSPASVRLSVHAVLTSSRRVFYRKEFETISHTEDTVTDDVYRGKGDIVIFNKVGGTLMTGNFNGVNNYPVDFFRKDFLMWCRLCHCCFAVFSSYCPSVLWYQIYWLGAFRSTDRIRRTNCRPTTCKLRAAWPQSDHSNSAQLLYPSGRHGSPRYYRWTVIITVITDAVSSSTMKTVLMELTLFCDQECHQVLTIHTFRNLINMGHV